MIVHGHSFATSLNCVLHVELLRPGKEKLDGTMVQRDHVLLVSRVKLSYLV